MALISGFASLASEVLWTRALIHVTGTTTYAFATILAAFLSGIAAGGAAARRLLRGAIDLRVALAALAAAAAAAVLLATVALGRRGAIDRALASLVGGPDGVGWRAGLRVSLAQGGACTVCPRAPVAAVRARS